MTRHAGYKCTKIEKRKEEEEKVYIHPPIKDIYRLSQCTSARDGGQKVDSIYAMGRNTVECFASQLKEYGSE